VKRISGRYRLTSLGKIVFNIWVKVVESAVKHHHQLKAIDSIMIMPAEKKEIPLEERQRIIDNLMDNQEIKDILASNGI
jgi:hypothetical protein